MKGTIKKSIIGGIFFSLTLLVFGLTYATFQNISQVNNGDVFTAEKINTIITNQEELKAKLDTIDTKQLANAWTTFDVNGNIVSQYNVSSVTRLGTGNWRVYFTETMANTDYVVSVAPRAGAWSVTSMITNRTTSYVDVRTGASNMNNYYDFGGMDVVVFGGK